MPTPDPQQQLPSRPNLDHLKYQAQDLRKAFQQGDAAASGRLRAHVSRLTDLDAGDAASDKITAGEAQLVIAREYGFSSWRALKSHVAHVNANADSVPSSDANAAFSREELIAYFAAVRDRDLDNLRQCLQANPALTEARVNEGAMSLRGEAFVDALHQPLTDRTLTAIHQASFSYHDRQAGHRRGDDVIRLLLEYGADPDAIGFDGNNGHCAPIVIASWDGGIETMQLLLEAGADVSGEQGVEALSTCASHDNTERFDLLQEFGAQASPWMLVKAGLSDRVVALIDEDPALLSQTDDDGYTLLQAAAKRMKADGFERLPEAGRRMAGAMIERGAEVDAFSAAAMNDVERLQSLLQADLEQAHQQMKDGNTAVNMAVQARSNDALRVMLEAGVEADTEALRWAARMDYTVACRLLIEHGAQVTDEVTLAAAWRNQDPDCLELVLANGGNPNAADIRGPLHWVAASPQSVQLLIDAGADVNMRTPGGTLTTPLHHAANNADSTQRLLAAGADPTLADANGDTPLDLAERDGAQEVVAMLRPRVEAALAIVHANDAFSHDELATWFTAFIERDLDAMRTCLQANSALTETRINDKVANLRGESLAAALREPLTVRSSTIIHLAANNRLDLPRTEPPRGAEAIQLLLGYGADPDAVGFNENTGHCTAIVIAAWIGGADPDKNDPEKLRLLLEAGADASGDQGIAALSTAASHDRINHFDLLVEYGAQASPWMLVRAGLTDRVLALVDEDPAWLSRQNEEGYLLVQGAVMRMQYDEGPEQTEGRRMAVALIERGAEVDVFTASALDDVELLQLILQADPEQIRQRTVDGRTAVHLAVLAGSSNTLALLLEAGADADEEAIVRATRMDDVECCRLLIEHGAPVNDRVMLSAAWRNQDPACLELVLANGANPSANDGRGTLHWVAAENPQSVQLLIDAGADVNMRASGNRDSTPLHHAIGNIDSTTRLLAVGADPTLGDDNGDTPLDLARRDGAQDVIEALESHIANTAQVRSANAAFSHDELVAYFDAFRERDLDALRAILDANPALTEARANDKVVGLRGEALDAALRESLTVHSSTAIHLAANNLLDLPRSEPPKGVEAIRLLLEYGADPDAMGYNENQGCCTSIVIAAWIGSARQTDPSKDDPVKLRLLLEAG
ncbi:MAG: hypothetical protein HN559_07765, partial [Gemmatimonadetes bacterium]|nr:hypothetical protein [Gemmatimonadota bacterium]